MCHPHTFDRYDADRFLGERFLVRHCGARLGNSDVRVCAAMRDGQVWRAYTMGGDTCIGVLYNRANACITPLLGSHPLPQYQLLEAVDAWEGCNSLSVFSLYEKSCGAVVYTEVGGQRLYLVIRMNLGHCGLPKGHMEKFESESDTARREIAEETGVSVTLDERFRQVVSYWLTGKVYKESIYFLGRFDGGAITIQPSEIRAYRLCPYEEARGLITHDNDRAVLDAAERWLNGQT
ncbi:MAG: NUDIX domain-containing protein [Clostridia bacterium]|nr:NUDIX domain-containing protein [Clostridia bacterium]